MTSIIVTVKFPGERDIIVRPMKQVPRVGDHMQLPFASGVKSQTFRVVKVVWVSMSTVVIELED